MRAQAVSIDAELGPDEATVAAPPKYRETIASIEAELGPDEETAAAPPKYRETIASIEAELGPDEETAAAPPKYRETIASIDAELEAEDETTTAQPPVVRPLRQSGARPPVAKVAFVEPSTERDDRFGGEALAPSAPEHGLPRASEGDDERTVQRVLRPVTESDDARTTVRSESARTPYASDPVDLTPTRTLRRSSIPPAPRVPRSLPPPPRLPSSRFPAPMQHPAATFAPAHAPPASRSPRTSVPPLAPTPEAFRSAPPPPSGAPRSKMPTLAPMAGTIPPPPSFRGGSRRIGWGVAAGVLAVAAGAAFMLRPTHGALVVTAAGSRGEPAEASVYIDGQLRCQSTPCRLSGLEPGTHLVRTESGERVSAERAVVVEAGGAATHHVTLDDPTPPSGLRLAAEGNGLRVFIDGRDVGSPPVVLDGLDAGDHVVRVEGDSDLYGAYEEKITISAGETRDLGVVQLPVRQGRLTIKAGEYAEGAEVTVDGKPSGTVPMVIDLDPATEHDVQISRAGFTDESYQVAFAAGQAERDLRVALEPLTPTSTRSRPATGRRRFASSTRPSTATDGSAIMNFNSIPVTRVILDGRVLGSTPVLGRRVSPGTHTVVFVHPDGARKVVSTTVGAGDRKTAAVKF